MNSDHSNYRLYKIGGISFILIAFAYVIIFIRFAIEQLDSGLDMSVIAMSFMTDLKSLFILMTTCSSIAGILYLPAILAIYFALKEIDKSSTVIATVLTIIMIPLILMQNTLNLAVMSIGSDFVVAETGVPSNGYLTASTIALAASFKAELFIVALFSIATILLGNTMRTTYFGEFTGYFGIIAGAVNLIIQVLSLILGSYHEAVLAGSFLGLILNVIWFIIVGYKLLKLPSVELNPPYD